MEIKLDGMSQGARNGQRAIIDYHETNRRGEMKLHVKIVAAPIDGSNDQ